jgi:hypothetical protein
LALVGKARGLKERTRTVRNELLLVFLEPARHICPGMNEISQVPYKGRLYVHGVSDCARLLVAKPFQREDVAFSSSNWIGTSEFDPFRSSIPSPWSPL